MSPPAQTPLYPWHIENNAHMGTFGGYSMPLWYPAGARKEHLSVITSAGLFDTSHMSVIRLSGPGAFDLLQYCFSKDLWVAKGPDRTKLPPGKCAYGVFLDEHGGVLDDAIVYVLSPEQYLVVVNAGMGRIICEHLQRQQSGRHVTIADHTNHLAKLDLQGPQSARVLTRILDQPLVVLETFPYFSFKGSITDAPAAIQTVRLIDGTPILLSRTGYTGEFGFELFVPLAAVEGLWQDLLKPDGDPGVIPCGLAARDSLRAGAMLPLSHQDIGPWPFQNNPWRFALPWASDQKTFTKSFLGSAALVAAEVDSYTQAFVGFDLRKIDVTQARVLNAADQEMGTVLTCVTDMAIDRHGDRVYSIASPDKPAGFAPKGLCCGFVKLREPFKTGEIVVLADQRRRLNVMITDDIRPHRTARMPMERML